MRKTKLLAVCMTAVLSLLSPQAIANDDNGLTVGTAAAGFALSTDTQLATLVVSPAEMEVVHIVADAFAKDVEMVSGRTPKVSASPVGSGNIIIGTIGTSPIIDELIEKGELQDKDIRGQWETFCLTTINYEGAPTLVIYGSDPRGTAFGVFELSRAMGVTPYVWWADVVPEHKDAIYVQTTGRVVGPPSVKYRGMFINDEDWGLQPWAAKKMDTDLADIGPRTYERVCELMLRLKGNYLWPGMHPCTKAFWYYKENPVVARRYQIVMGSSHCEPLLRNNVDEWTNNFTSEYGHASGDWNWATNSETIKQYWTDRVIESKNNDAIYTIGMRGIHDSGMPGYSGNAAKNAALKEVIAAQREILSTNLDKPASEVPQIFCPYKEALTLYQMGLDLPEDVTLLWADDNFGYVRQLSNTEEQKRSGGGGVYYHFSYWGVPYDHLWLSSVSPTLTSYELRKAYDMNCKNIWIFNVGDIKPQEAEFQFAMDFSWDVEKWSPESAYSYTEYWAEEYFGAAVAKDIAKVKNEYYRLAASGKPEHVHAINYTRQEVEQRLADYLQLEQDVENLRPLIPSRLADAFYEMVYYPVMGAANINKKVLYAKMSFYAAEEGDRNLVSDYGYKALQAYEKIVAITNEYNHSIAGGKWEGMMDFAPRGLSYFYEPAVASLSSVNASHTKTDETSQTQVISASKFTAKGGSNDFKVIEGLGISDSSVTILPLNMTAYTSSNITSAPYLEYDIPVTAGNNNITVKCLPTFPLNTSYKLRFATSINQATPVFHDITLAAETSPWSTYVVTGYSMATVSYNSTEDGTAKLRIYLADPGVVVSAIEVSNPKPNGNLVEGLINPGFEYKSEGVQNNGAVTRGDPWGWERVGTLLGNSYGISSDATGYEGTSICWYNSTPMPDFFEMSQTLNGLEAGKYLVKCKLGVFSGTQTNQRLFANQSVQYYGHDTDYAANIVEGETYTFANHTWGVAGGAKGQLYEMAVKVTLAEGEPLKVGIRSSNMLSNGNKATDNSGWFKVDDFRIERVTDEEEEGGDEPTDSVSVYTKKITNNSFEYKSEGVPNNGEVTRGDPYGWKREGTLLGNSWGISSDAEGREGTSICWYNSSPMPDVLKLYQDIEDMPYGHYTLRCKLNAFADLLTNQRIFANKYVQYYGYEKDYPNNLSTSEYATFANWSPTSKSFLKPMVMDFYLFPGETLTLGVLSSNLMGNGSRATNNAGWFKVDNFELEFHGDDVAQFVAHVESLNSEAQLLTDSVMSVDCKEAIRQAIASCELISEESDMEAIKVATNLAIDALAAARISIQQYRVVSRLIQQANAIVETLDESYDSEGYTSDMAPIVDALNQGTLELDKDYAALINACVMRAVKSQTNPGADMTLALTSASCASMEGWQYTGGNTIQLNTWSTEGINDGTGMRTPFIEDWVAGSSNKPLNDACIFNSVDGLHSGIYCISALVRAYREYAGSGDLEGGYLFAGNDTVSVSTGSECFYGTKTGVFGNYSAEVELSDDDQSITYGIIVKDANFNWIAFKNFTMTYVGPCNEETGITKSFPKQNYVPTYFTLDGRRTYRPSRGLTIVRAADGMYKKEILR